MLSKFTYLIQGCSVQLTINGYNTYYWESESGAECEFCCLIHLKK